MKRATDIFIIVMLLSASSCEKVIELDIDDSDKQVVIEADLYAGTNEFEVIVTNSSLYNESTLNTPIENATVILEDDLGGSTIIPHGTNGVYSDTITALPNHTYTLKVNIDGTQYVASTHMHETVYINSIFTDFQTNVFTLDTGYAVVYSFLDPAGGNDYYRIKVYENGVLNNTPLDLRIFDDIPEDGFEIERNTPGGYFDSGTEVTLELLHMDKESFSYLTTMGNISGATVTPTPTPANPPTNWSNNALGAFIAYAGDTASIVIP